MDPDILAALDNFDDGDYEEFDENFIAELQEEVRYTCSISPDWSSYH